MRNILRKLHIVPGQPEDAPDGLSSPSSSKGGGGSGNGGGSPLRADQKPLSGLSSWLSSVGSRHAASSPPPVAPSAPAVDGLREGAGSSRTQEPGMDDEEYQIQLALELSAKEDPEAAQIEAVKQISLGSCPSENTPAEVLAYRYWNYNALGYDDKILDGFYDLYGILVESTLSKMPSLVDLQGTPVSDGISWEAVLVNRAEDADLLELEQKALMMALALKSESLDFAASDLVQSLGIVVANQMGGAVCDPISMLKSWRYLSNYLRASTGNMVMPIGRLTTGLARHRALLFKVLADSLGIPCRLVKGQQYTGSDDGALNIVKFKDGREYIVDLMADPGTLIPSDGASLARDCKETLSINSGVSSSVGCYSENEPLKQRFLSDNLDTSDSGRDTLGEPRNQESQRLNSSLQKSSAQEFITAEVKIPDDFRNTSNARVAKAQEPSGRPNHPYTITRSPSWTEGISSPAVRMMKVKDISQYMINATKENPELAQKLHDVLLESGVVAPPNLFTEICTEPAEAVTAEDMNVSEDKDEITKRKNDLRHKILADGGRGPFLPRLPIHDVQRKAIPSSSHHDSLKPVEGLGFHRPLDVREATVVPSSQSEASAVQLQDTPLQFIKHKPVAAAAATAAVVASSMIVAAAKSNNDMHLEVPVAAAATATAAAVVATTAAVSRQYEYLESCTPARIVSDYCDNTNLTQKTGDILDNLQLSSDHGHDGGLVREQDASEAHQEMEKISDKSTGNESAKSEISLDDVAELEIPWEDIIMGERIGLGSFGEVYRGEWHGTEVAVKKFLHQDISSDALEEFITEVRIMKRLRHPNVVLLMGAVTHVPNLSIVTEFLPRGSLFRLIHRPNNQLDERRCLRMALDVARGMNYLHNCTPVIVHRDLKSPNLLVDKNWVVKVCDFGLSRMKHNTFLSSRSTAGTAEWMAPEVLRNEPSDEKCDVFSFGVILWELCTLQQPWGGMNPMQVVGAVGFQHRRLDIPDDMDPAIADIIKKCWQTDPKMRPSFSEIMSTLKPLQKPVSSNQAARQRTVVADNTEKGAS